MSVSLLDDSLKVNIYFDRSDSEFDDDICIQLIEDCPEEERLLKYEETNIYITPDQACLLILALERAMKDYRGSCQEL